MSIILYAILVFIAYQVIFKFIIPVYRATRRFKQGFREMQERFNSQQADSPQPGDDQRTKTKPAKEDYIEFEEIK